MFDPPSEHTDRNYTIEVEAHGDRDQTEEAFVVRFADGRTESVRLHDYERVYEVPGLYESVVQQRLRCDSPALLTDMLLRAAGVPPATLRVLDLGAGTGAIAEALRARGVEMIVGADKVEAAREAALRDRPQDLYAEYLVCDAGDTDQLAEPVTRLGLNTLVCASALGANHITASAFAAIWDLFRPGGRFAINVNQALCDSATSEIGEYLSALRLTDSGTEILFWEPFQHRMSVAGKPIGYVAIGARKHAGAQI